MFIVTGILKEKVVLTMISNKNRWKYRSFVNLWQAIKPSPGMYRHSDLRPFTSTLYLSYF